MRVPRSTAVVMQFPEGRKFWISADQITRFRESTSAPVEQFSDGSEAFWTGVSE